MCGPPSLKGLIIVSAAFHSAGSEEAITAGCDLTLDTLSLPEILQVDLCPSENIKPRWSQYVLLKNGQSLPLILGFIFFKKRKQHCY